MNRMIVRKSLAQLRADTGGLFHPARPISLYHGIQPVLSRVALPRRIERIPGRLKALVARIAVERLPMDCARHVGIASLGGTLRLDQDTFLPAHHVPQVNALTQETR